MTADDQSPHDGDLLGLERAYKAALSVLNEQQKAFVRVYLIDLNATKAAETAGYSKGTARQQGSRLLSNANVKRAVGFGRRIREHRLNLSQDTVIANLIAVRDQALDAMPVFNSRGELIDGIWQYDGRTAVKAVELLGKHQGMFGTAKDGHISLEAHNNLVSQMGIEVVNAITECVENEADRTTLIAAIDRRWQAIGSEPNRTGTKRPS